MPALSSPATGCRRHDATLLVQHCSRRRFGDIRVPARSGHSIGHACATLHSPSNPIDSSHKFLLRWVGIKLLVAAPILTIQATMTSVSALLSGEFPVASRNR